MALEDTKSIDLVCKGDANTVVLVVTDSLDWSEIKTHLYLLQEKLSSYCTYVENGQLYADFPAMRDARPVIEHIYFHAPPSETVGFFDRLGLALDERGILFKSHVYGEGSEKGAGPEKGAG